METHCKMQVSFIIFQKMDANFNFSFLRRLRKVQKINCENCFKISLKTFQFFMNSSAIPYPNTFFF